MVREYLKQNVYDALLERLDFIFREFDNIYISFSGGKDSGLLLNLLLDFLQKHYPDRPIGVFHQDFEAQYTVTTEYIERTFERIKDRVEPYWVCLPMGHLPLPDAPGGSGQTVRPLVPDVPRRQKNRLSSGYAGGRIPPALQRFSQ